MVSQVDPNAPATDTGNGLGSGQAGGSTDVVPRAEHERILEEERRRRSGQESAHQRQLAKLNEQINSLTEEVKGMAERGASAPITEEDLKNLDPDDPRDATTIKMYRTMAQWTSHLSDREKALASESERQRLVGEAVSEVIATGVPRDALDLSSADMVRASAAQWRSEERVRTLERDIEVLKADKKAAIESAETAVTRSRLASGENRVSTSTGSRPPQPTENEEALQALNEAKARAKRARRGGDVVSLTQIIAALEDGDITASQALATLSR